MSARRVRFSPIPGQSQPMQGEPNRFRSVIPGAGRPRSRASDGSPSSVSSRCGTPVMGRRSSSSSSSPCLDRAEEAAVELDLDNMEEDAGDGLDFTAMDAAAGDMQEDAEEVEIEHLSRQARALLKNRALTEEHVVHGFASAFLLLEHGEEVSVIKKGICLLIALLKTEHVTDEHIHDSISKLLPFLLHDDDSVPGLTSLAFLGLIQNKKLNADVANGLAVELFQCLVHEDSFFIGNILSLLGPLVQTGLLCYANLKAFFDQLRNFSTLEDEAIGEGVATALSCFLRANYTAPGITPEIANGIRNAALGALFNLLNNNNPRTVTFYASSLHKLIKDRLINDEWVKSNIPVLVCKLLSVLSVDRQDVQLSALSTLFGCVKLEGFLSGEVTDQIICQSIRLLELPDPMMVRMVNTHLRAFISKQQINEPTFIQLLTALGGLCSHSQHEPMARSTIAICRQLCEPEQNLAHFQSTFTQFEQALAQHEDGQQSEAAASQAAAVAVPVDPDDHTRAVLASLVDQFNGALFSGGGASLIRALQSLMIHVNQMNEEQFGQLLNGLRVMLLHNHHAAVAYNAIESYRQNGTPYPSFFAAFEQQLQHALQQQAQAAAEQETSAQIAAPAPVAPPPSPVAAAAVAGMDVDVNDHGPQQAPLYHPFQHVQQQFGYQGDEYGFDAYGSGSESDDGGAMELEVQRESGL